MLIGSRRAARERAVSLLYEAEIKDLSPAELLAELPVEPDAFALALVRGVGDNLERIDALLARRALRWRLERMPALDRNILRMGAYEILDRPDIPAAVTISEAVELAKQYSTEDSGRWVNGVLAGLVREIGPPGQEGSSV